MFYYFNMFIIGAFLGFIFEFILKTWIFTSMNSSILYGPWLPVYGVGICLGVFIERLIFNRVKASKIVKIFIMFLLIVFFSTLIELLGGIFIEKTFGKVFWNYNKFKFNFGKYIALEISLIWGILSLFFLFVIKPKFDKMIKKIPRVVTTLVLSMMLIDFILALILKV